MVDGLNANDTPDGLLPASDDFDDVPTMATMATTELGFPGSFPRSSSAAC
jgi:hypothetical protein